MKRTTKTRLTVAAAAMATAAVLVTEHTIATSQHVQDISGAGAPISLATSPGPGFVDSVDEQVPPATPSHDEAAKILATILRAEISPGIPKYERKFFGATWADPDHNGCDGREDAIALWLHSHAERGMCTVSGSITDVYTGTGLTLPSGADLDHVVPLKAAWVSGAWTWTPERRLAFANDPENLIPVSASANRSKGQKTPDAWMPPLESYWCEYIRAYIGVKGKPEYSLAMTAAEAEASELALQTCSTGAPS